MADRGKSKKDKKKDKEANETPAPALTDKMLNELLKVNPSLRAEYASAGGDAAEMLKKLSMQDLLTGLTPGGKDQKDMASYKFWQTQPVPRFDDKVSEEGPMKVLSKSDVRSEPGPMIAGYEWVTMDLEDQKQVEEVYQLLTGHYVEDDEALFRFDYSSSFLAWALKAPGWRKEWHIGVRATVSQKLVAFISGIPVTLRVREKTIASSEINFLCIHKKLRAKRLAPELIKEVTRRCNLVEIWQAIYTAGVLLPKPISTCRYYHRSLNWAKLHEVKFSPLPHGSTKARQISKYKLPDSTSTPGLRLMEAKDVLQVTDLLDRFLKRFDVAPIYSKEEVKHWLLHDPEKCPERVIWTYVVEDPSSHKVTDFFSFYSLDSTIVKSTSHGSKTPDVVRAAYLFYNGTESAFEDPTSSSELSTTTRHHGLSAQRSTLRARLNQLMADALILAKNGGFDVFNALTLQDNALFLQDQKFGPGDGYLHYYLYNYRTAPVKGGFDEKQRLDEEHGSGVGVIMM